MNRCLFCGGDARSPEHFKFCDGRQGRLEAALERECGTVAEEFPPLASGLEPETWATSEAAAMSVEDQRATQRNEVLHVIRAAGRQGATDDEIQERLQLDGSSERPRRWELWKLDAITMLRDERGEVVKRLTRTHRRAVVWVACA